MLYQTVRPQNLSEIVGNSVTVGALRTMLRKPSEERPHTILLKGPSGCGKTTVARILAKEFGSIDLSTIELNAANTRGIDTIREISGSAFLIGLGGKSKTYIFDESHQLTSPAQEALLKVIEDNPPHCYFILCTTEPQNIIKTVRNRCAEYELSLLPRQEIIKVLEIVCEKKKLDIDKDIIEAISYTSEGSPRVALVSLEQVAEVKDVDQALELLVKGTEKDLNVIDLCKLLLANSNVRRKKWKQIIETFSNISEDPERVRRSILTFMFNKLCKCEEIDEAKDISNLMTIFSYSVYYGGKSQLASLVMKACFGDRE